MGVYLVMEIVCRKNDRRCGIMKEDTTRREVSQNQKRQSSLVQKRKTSHKGSESGAALHLKIYAESLTVVGVILFAVRVLEDLNTFAVGCAVIWNRTCIVISLAAPMSTNEMRSRNIWQKTKDSRAVTGVS